jgi:hypothetical protein
MSKKDKKRIAELERQQSILSAKIRVMREQQVTLRDNFILHLLEEHSQIFEQGSIPQSEPKQPEAAKDSPTMDGATFGKLERGESVLPQSILNKPKFNKANFDKLRGGVFCNNTKMPDPIMTEKEQELLAKLNAELAKFSSLEAFNADRKNFFLPPVGKLEFDKMKAAIECTIAIAKMVRPDYFDQINQIKVPVSEQPKAETKQGSDGADSPKTYDTIFDKPEQGIPNLAARNEPKQPKIDTPEPQKATLIKTVLDRVKEMEKLLANPNLGVGELTFFIDDWTKELQLDLADFRRKVLDLGRVEPCKVDLRNSEQGEVEPKEVEQGEEKQPQTDQLSPEKDSEKLAGAEEDSAKTYDTIFDKTEQGLPNKKAQKDFIIIQTNPNYSDNFAPFYLKYVDKYNVISHTPNAKDAMKFNNGKEANAFLNKVISDSSARYIPSNFGLRKLDEYGIVTTHY